MKYKITQKQKTVNGVTLYQIQALKDFGNVGKGELGGWIEKEQNLSQSGDAWVYGDAKVCGNAKVYGDAWVYGNAKVCGNAVVCGNAEICGYDAPTPNSNLPDILSTLPKEVTSITISGKTYKLETKWVLQDKVVD